MSDSKPTSTDDGNAALDAVRLTQFSHGGG